MRKPLAAIQREKVTGIAMGLRILPALPYGKEHSYGNSLTGSGTEESVAKLTWEDLVKFHQTWFRPNNGTLVVVGDTTMGEITPKLEKLFGGWTRRDVPVKNISRVQFPAKPVVYIMDRLGALQSDILVGQVAPPRNSPDQIAIETMNSIFGSDFGARINMNLREDKHWCLSPKLNPWQTLPENVRCRSTFFAGLRWEVPDYSCGRPSFDPSEAGLALNSSICRSSSAFSRSRDSPPGKSCNWRR